MCVHMYVYIKQDEVLRIEMYAENKNLVTLK